MRAVTKAVYKSSQRPQRRLKCRPLPHCPAVVDALGKLKLAIQQNPPATRPLLLRQSARQPAVQSNGLTAL